MGSNMFCLVSILLPALAGAVLLIWKDVRRAPLVVGASAGSLVFAILSVIFKDKFTAIAFSGALSISFEVDSLGAVFVVLIPAAFLLASVFALEYEEHDPKAARLFGFMLLSLGAMNGLAASGNMLTFYLFFELLTFASFPMILHNGSRPARAAAVKYLGFSVFGASLALFGCMLAGINVFSPFSAGYAAVGNGVLACLLISVGFLCKAGLYPLSSWLPTAHPEAPSPASALLSGIITKAGILGFIRAVYFVFGPDTIRGTYAQYALIILSLVTILMGSILAYREKIFKKRLAFSSVSQLSYIVFGLALLNPAGFAGAMLQVVFHCFAKTGLFLCAGAIIHSTGVVGCGGFEGMGRRLPAIMTAFTVLSLSLIGIPPFGGFVAKWSLGAGAFAFGAPFDIIGTAVLMVSALFTAGYLLPLASAAFFPGRGITPERAHAGLRMIVPVALLAVSVLVLGIFPAFNPLFENIAHALAGGAL